MKINFDKNSVVIFGKSYKLDVLVRKFAILSGDQIFHFLSNRRIQMPRAVNVMALTALLNKKIVTLNSNDLTQEEFERLQYYPYFTEEQLFRLVKRLGINDEEFEEYRIYLFKLIIENFEGLDITDGEISYLKSLKKLPIESFDKYFNYISAASLETKTSFDGREIEDLKKYFPLTATDEDINDLCEKYGLEIPYELDHAQFLEYANYYLNSNGQMSRAVALELQRMSFEQLTTYCDRINLPMHVNMSTEERAIYLLFYLSMCDISKTNIDKIVAEDSYYPIEFSIAFEKLENDNCSVVILKNDENVIEELEISNDESLDNKESTDNTTIINEGFEDELSKVSEEETTFEVYEEISEETIENTNNVEESEETRNEYLEYIDEPIVVEDLDSSQEETDEPQIEETFDHIDEIDNIKEYETLDEFQEETPEEVKEVEEASSYDEIIYPENNPFEEELILNDNFDNSDEEFVKLEDENSNIDETPIEEYQDNKSDIEEVDAETEALINSILENDKEEIEIPFQKDESLNKVYENELFGDKKILKLKESKAKMIILFVILGLAVILTIFLSLVIFN